MLKIVIFIAEQVYEILSVIAERIRGELACAGGDDFVCAKEEEVILLILKKDNLSLAFQAFNALSVTADCKNRADIFKSLSLALDFAEIFEKHLAVVSGVLNTVGNEPDFFVLI